VHAHMLMMLKCLADQLFHHLLYFIVGRLHSAREIK